MSDLSTATRVSLGQGGERVAMAAMEYDLHAAPKWRLLGEAGRGPLF